jgi:ADP-heptose:LPS heptosyltransferase
MIIDARCDFRLSLLMGILKGKIKVGFDYGLARYCYNKLVPYGKRSLRKDDYAKLLFAFNIQSSKCLPFIEIDNGSEKFASAKQSLDGISYPDKEFFIVHPGASWKYRRWNIEKLLILVKYVKKITELKLLIIGSYEDEKSIDIIINKIGGVKLILPLDLLPYIIRHSRFIVCNNTGVMHIADALNVPALVIMGPTDRETWMPSRENIHLLFHNTEKYWCYPCNELTCFNPDNPCIENVAVDDVIQTLSAAFQNGWANMKVR